MNLNGATALMTGGERGLGKAFVRELLDLGATVYASARNPEPSQTGASSRSPRDVTDAAAVSAVAELAAMSRSSSTMPGSVGRDRCSQADLDDIRAVFEANGFGAI